MKGIRLSWRLFGCRLVGGPSEERWQREEEEEEENEVGGREKQRGRGE